MDIDAVLKYIKDRRGEIERSPKFSRAEYRARKAELTALEMHIMAQESERGEQKQ